MPKRIELHAKTKYSMDHESTLDIKDLILKCASNGEKGVAIVDKDSVISFLKAEKVLKELNIKDFKLIYGVELNVEYKNLTYKVVTLIKNKKGISKLYRSFSSYLTNKRLLLEDLIKNKDNLVLGLVYDENIMDESLLSYFDYVEVDKNVSQDIIAKLKKKTIVVYSNKINAVSDEEDIAKKVLYNKLEIDKEIDNRIYQTTEEILKEINDLEIVVDNPNKIFNMIEKFDILDDRVMLPNNTDFDIELLVYIQLNEKFGDYVPKEVMKRIEEELKLIHEYNYDGYINIYKAITDKCKNNNEEYVICDYINYLYIAYLLGITHFDPIKTNLNYDIFFAHHPSISIKLSLSFSENLLEYIINEKGLKTIRCKGLMELKSNMLNKAIVKYEDENNIKLTSKEKLAVTKYLENYPLNNQAVTLKRLILPQDFNIFLLMPRELISDGNLYYRYTNIDYKDIEHKFLTLELLANDKITELSELKEMTGDSITHSDYQDKRIIDSEYYKNYLKSYDNALILDDLYEDLINSNNELPLVFNIINEIRKDKKVSKKNKEILDKNGIKLKKYHDLNFINRGILNERVRLVYELLYFKEYYPLEYYYVMLKNCPFKELIEITKKGYDEVVNKIKDYPQYRYEYNYLNLVKEMYEANILFCVEERMIVEDYTFELDKENAKLTLIINKVNSEFDRYLANDLSLIGTRPLNGKMPYMSKLIIKLLNENEDVTLFGLDGPINFYVEYLLNEITGIERKVIRAYLNPCSCYKDEVFVIDKESFINGLKYLLSHDLFIKDLQGINTALIEGADTLLDKILYMIKDSDSKIIIIDNPKCLKEDFASFLKELKIISKKNRVKFIIFTTLKKEFEETHKKDISSFLNSELLDSCIEYISILDGEELYVVKDWEQYE